MGTKAKDSDGITRRDFTTRVGSAAAAVALGGEFFHVSAQTNGRIRGANDRVVVANIGVRGQGNALKRGFAPLKNVEIKTLCDIDANLEASRVNDKELAGIPTFKPNFVQDMRRVLDDKDIDAVTIATPNHWHALATIWALQAGKHVYVEKPASHTIWEGRRMVEAAARYGKVVQVGTMNRSRPAVKQAIQYIKDGGLGKVYMARGLCFKPRAGIGKYPDGPMAPGEQYKLSIGGDHGGAGVRRRLPVEGRLRHVARPGAEAAVQPQSLPLQLALALGLRQRRHGQPGSAPVRHRALGPWQAGASHQSRLHGRVLRA